jgi:phosphoglucomutase/phosphomannomutase
LGCAVRKSLDPNAPWTTLTGNQLGSLLVDFMLGQRKSTGTLTAENYVVKTLVTTELIRRIADHYGVETAGNLHVGFKWIGAEMDARGPKQFVLGMEESYGFLAGDHVRDKDAAVASLLTAEMTAKLKHEGKTLYQHLDALMLQYGCFTESQINVQMPGEKGMEDMRALMAKVRTLSPLNAPRGDMVILDFAKEGNYIAIRPSGTEPKVKIYLFAYDPPSGISDLESTKTAQAERIKAVGNDFRAFSGT